MSTFDNPDYAMSNPLNDLKIDDLPLIFMVLNDDCLLFILDYIDILELLNIRKVCQRFFSLADRCRHKYQNFDAGFIYSKDEVYKILQYLGPIVKDLTMSGHNFDLKPILEFCPNLESLTLKIIQFFDRTIIENMKSVVKQLKHLHLSGFRFNDDLGECFDEALKLESFSCKLGITPKFIQNFSGMKSLKLYDCSFTDEVLKRNPTLEILELRYSYDGILNDIVKYTSGVKELKLHICQDLPSLSCLSSLPLLKKLHLFFYHEFAINRVNELLNELSHKNSIEELSICYSAILYYLAECFLPVISKLTNLKKLYLHDLNNSDLKNLHSLKNLEELEVRRGLFSDDALLELIRALTNLKKIRVIEFSATIKFVKELIEILKQQAESRPKLEITVIDFFNNSWKSNEEIKMLLSENRKILKLILKI